MMLTQQIILALVAIAGTLITYYVSSTGKQGPVRSSALLALIVGGWFYFFPHVLPEFYSKQIPLYLIGGSFIGMVTTKTNITLFSLILSPIVFSVIMSFSSKFFAGYGGAIGTMACISLMGTMAFPILTKNKKVSYGYRFLRVKYKMKKRKR